MKREDEMPIIEFIRARAKILSKGVVARLEAMEALDYIVQTARADYKKRNVRVKTDETPSES